MSDLLKKFNTWFNQLGAKKSFGTMLDDVEGLIEKGQLNRAERRLEIARDQIRRYPRRIPTIERRIATIERRIQNRRP